MDQIFSSKNIFSLDQTQEVQYWQVSMCSIFLGQVSHISISVHSPQHELHIYGRYFLSSDRDPSNMYSNSTCLKMLQQKLNYFLTLKISELTLIRNGRLAFLKGHWPFSHRVWSADQQRAAAALQNWSTSWTSGDTLHSSFIEKLWLLSVYVNLTILLIFIHE